MCEDLYAKYSIMKMKISTVVGLWTLKRNTQEWLVDFINNYKENVFKSHIELNVTF